MTSRTTHCLFCSKGAATTPRGDKSLSYPLRQLAELFLTKVGGGYFSIPQDILACKDKDASISALCSPCHELIKEIIQIQTQIGQLQTAVGNRVLLLRRKVLDLDAKEATNCSKTEKTKRLKVDKLRRKVRNALLGLPGHDDNIVRKPRVGCLGGQMDDEKEDVISSCGGDDDFVIHPEPDEWTQDIKIELEQVVEEEQELCEDRISPSNSPLRRSSRRTTTNNDQNAEGSLTSTPKKPLLKRKSTHKKSDDSENSDSECELPSKQQIDKAASQVPGRKEGNRILCQLCGKSYKSKDYRCHMNAHQGIRRVFKKRDYDCATCGEKFVHRNSLKTHRITKHGDDPYSCDLCGAKFMTTKGLDRHRMLHSGVKPHKCDVCDARFFFKTELTYHTRVHTGERPYVCKHCPQACSSSSNLISHIKAVHTPGYVAPKPFLCQDCGKTFRRKNLLDGHVRMRHTGERPFACGVCDKGFALQTKLNLHSARVHGVGNNGPESQRDESPESEDEEENCA